MKTFFELTDNMSLYTPEFIRSACQKLSLKARCLYELLLRRTGLSIHNGEKWYTPNLGVFVIYPREEAAKMLNCSLRTITSVFRQLVCAGLIFEERVGLGKANRIYVLKPDLSETAPSRPARKKPRQKHQAVSAAEKKQAEETAETTSAPESPQQPPEPIFSKEEANPAEREKAPHRPAEKPQRSRRRKAPAFFVPDELTEQIKEQIDYPCLAENARQNRLGISKRVLDMIVRCLSELLAAPSTQVNGIVYSWEECEQMMEGLDADCILAFLEKLRQTSFERVHNCRAYVKSMLFNFMDEWAMQLQSWEEEIRMGLAVV